MPRKVSAGSKRTTRSATLARRDPFGAIRAQLKNNGTSKLVTRSTSAQRKMVKGLLEGLEDKDIDALLRNLAEGKKEPAYVGNERVANKDRIDFSSDVKKKFWRDNAAAPCAICNAPIPPAQRSIDHKEPWATIRIGVATMMVCKHNVHWEVTLLSDLQRLYDDEGNLRPTHKGCNSSKGGPKGNDSITPKMQPKNVCPGEGCGLPKAT